MYKKNAPCMQTATVSCTGHHPPCRLNVEDSDKQALLFWDFWGLYDEEPNRGSLFCDSPSVLRNGQNMTP